MLHTYYVSNLRLAESQDDQKSRTYKKGLVLHTKPRWGHVNYPGRGYCKYEVGGT